MSKTFGELSEEAYETACSKGWHDKATQFGTTIALMHTEVTEAYEVYEAVEMDFNHLTEELADVLIRVFDTCGLFDINLDLPFSQEFGTNVFGDVLSSPSCRAKTRHTDVFLMKLHSQLSKVMETYRRELEDTNNKLAVQFAVVISMILGFSKALDLPIEEVMTAKMEKNKKRAFKHGGKRV